MPEHSIWKEEVQRRLAGLKLPPARESEIIEELASHLDDDYRKLLAGGATEAEALEIVGESLTDSASLSEEIQAIERSVPPEPIVWDYSERTNRFADFWRDFRYSLRTLKKSPGFTVVAVLSLALGIGGNAAMFSIVRAVLLRPLPYPEPGRLVRLTNSGYYPPGGVVDLQQESRTMDVAGFSTGAELNLTGQGEPWRLKGSSVSANFFHVIGAEMALGRAFHRGEDQPGADNLVILSHSLWQERFGADAGILGRVITLGGVDRQVVGVAGSGFAFPDSTIRFWIPLHLDPRDPTQYWAYGFMPVVGRLRDGVTLRQAQAETRSLSLRMVSLFPYAMGRDWAAQMTALPLQEYVTSEIRTRLIVLQCAIGLVLLIACTNVAGLLLARASARRKEMALRAALGAGRARIVRQLLTESVVLALAGGAIGVAVAFGAVSVFQMALPAATNGWSAVETGWQVLIFAGVLSVATGLAFGLAPALSASRQNLAATIRSGGQRGAGSGRARVRSALIMGEMGLAVVLTVSAGLLIRTLWMLAQVNLGFQAQHMLTIRVSPNPSLCRDRAACIALYGELQRRTLEIPGVEDAATANTVPLSSDVPGSSVKVEGQPYVPAEHAAPMFWAGAVTPEYFRVMDIRILQGRGFNSGDGEKAAPVVIVSAATARRYWPGENPIGKHIQLVWEPQGRTVIGVAADVRQFDLADHSPDFVRGAMYTPYAQTVDNNRQLPSAMTLLVRTHADSAVVAGRVRELVRDLNSNVPVSEIRTMVSLVDQSTRQSRFMMWLFVSFGAAALLLAAIGVYGIVSYTAAQRSFEMAVRMALGATRRNIFSLVLAQSLWLVAGGLALGVAASLALTRMLATFLYGATPTDPLTFLAVGGLLVMVAILAGLVPARRATKVDPQQAIRAEC